MDSSVFDPRLVLAAMKSVTLVFGGILTWLSMRAYRRTGAPALRALGLGIGLVTAGAFLGGLLHQTDVLGLELSVSVQSVFTAVGFGVLTYSLYVDGSSVGVSRRIGRSDRRE
jgi:hypothetical protein